MPVLPQNSDGKSTHCVRSVQTGREVGEHAGSGRTLYAATESIAATAGADEHAGFIDGKRCDTGEQFPVQPRTPSRSVQIFELFEIIGGGRLDLRL
jgi:hypothetical protein